jgi:FkbM family methyltransferase
MHDRLHSVRRRARSKLLLFVRAGLATIPRGPVYLGDHTALVATRWGGVLLVNTRDLLFAPTVLLHGLWEPEVTDWVQSTVRPGQVFVDIGANVGYYSVLAARLVGPAGRVVAVEAHPHSADMLRRNIVLNGLSEWVTTWQRAAWSGTETMSFYLRSHFAGNSSAGSIPEEGLARLGDTEQVVKVQGVAVDDLLTDLPKIDVIKIDVEGAEVRALSGLSRTLSVNPGIRIMFEWSPGQLELVGDEPQRLIDLLVEKGLRFRLLKRGKLRPITPSQLLETPYGNVVAAH